MSFDKFGHSSYGQRRVNWILDEIERTEELHSFLNRREDSIDMVNQNTQNFVTKHYFDELLDNEVEVFLKILNDKFVNFMNSIEQTCIKIFDEMFESIL